MEDILGGKFGIECISPRSIEIERIDKHHHHIWSKSVYHIPYLALGMFQTPVVDGLDRSRVRKPLGGDKGIEIILQQVHIAVADAEIVVYPYGISRLHNDGVIAAEVLCLEHYASESRIELGTGLSSCTLCQHRQAHRRAVRGCHDILISTGNSIHMAEKRQ